MTKNADKLKALKSINTEYLTKSEAKEFTILLEELTKREFQEKSTSTFMDFVTSIWKEFIWLLIWEFYFSNKMNCTKDAHSYLK